MLLLIILSKLFLAKFEPINSGINPQGNNIKMKNLSIVLVLCALTLAQSSKLRSQSLAEEQEITDMHGITLSEVNSEIESETE